MKYKNWYTHSQRIEKAVTVGHLVHLSYSSRQPLHCCRMSAEASRELHKYEKCEIFHYMHCIGMWDCDFVATKGWHMWLWMLCRWLGANNLQCPFWQIKGYILVCSFLFFFIYIRYTRTDNMKYASIFNEQTMPILWVVSLTLSLSHTDPDHAKGM